MHQPSYDDLVSMVPEWCDVGNLVLYLDWDSDLGSKLCLITDYYVMDPAACLNQAECLEMIEQEEWLMIHAFHEGNYITDYLDAFTATAAKVRIP